MSATGQADRQAPMKIPVKHFSIPFCIFDEPLPSKSLKLLVFLFSKADFNGASQPGYSAMREAIRDQSSENGSKTTVRRYLELLEKRGWIFHMKRTSGRMAIWLQIPPRFRKSKAPSLVSVVQS